jgi:putative transposase
VENLNVKGMVRNHNLAKAISDVGWGTFTNFLAYKLKCKGAKLVEIDSSLAQNFVLTASIKSAKCH